MIVKSEEEKRIARELRQKVITENAARREKQVNDRFEDTRERFLRNVDYWNGTKDQPPKAQTLRVHRDTLHRRLLWTSNDALNWNRRDDGTYFLNQRDIDSLHKPMALLLQFVKAEHKIAHDRATLALRAQQASARAAKKEEKTSKSDERPHTPELSV